MKTLIIPDLHNHIEHAEYWLATQHYDRVVFLGDFFDDFGDGPVDAKRTAAWVRTRIAETEDLFLRRNHDGSYMFPENPQLYCPGFTVAKAKAVRKVLGPEHWRRFRLAVAD